MAIWPFGRRQDAAATAPEPEVADSVSPDTGEADVARPERVPTGDWMLAPPMKTAMAPTMPTSFRVQRLPEILTSHQDTRLSGSLGHAVSSDGPSGTVGGLALATGSVSHEGSRTSPELREPPHASPTASDVGPSVQRRLAIIDDAPLAVAGGTDGALATTAQAPTPALPEPAVSRVLASRGPTPPSGAGVPPLPVARVVDAPAPSPASRPFAGDGANAGQASPAPAPASSSDEPPSETGLVGDDRVGGFEVDLGSLLGGGADEARPVIAPPADLAPPIQRSFRRAGDPAPPLRAPVQRAADATPTATPSAPASPPIPSPATDGGTAETAALPPIQRLASTAPLPSASTPSSPPAERPAFSSTAAASDDHADTRPSGEAPGDGAADRPLTGAAPSPVQLDRDPSLLATGPMTADTAGSGTSDRPLVAPTVQRATDLASAASQAPSAPTPASAASADPSVTATSPEAGPAVGSPAPSSPAPASPPDAAAGPAAGVDPGPAVQRAADEEGDHFPGDGHDHGDESGVQRVADTTATAPLAGEAPSLTGGAGIESTLAGEDDDAAPMTSGDLPLVARMAEPSAPTLGTGGDRDAAIPLQTLADTVLPMSDGGTASLPLAPTDGPGNLIPPTPSGSSGPSGTTTGLIGDSPATLAGGSSLAGAGTSGSASAGSPLVAQRVASPASAGRPGDGSASLPFAVQRQAAAPSFGGGSAPGSAPLGTTAGLLSGGLGGLATGEVSPGALTILGAPPADAAPVALQRSFDAPLFAPAASAPTASPNPPTGSATTTPTSASSGGTASSGQGAAGATTPVSRLPLASATPSTTSAPGSITPVTDLPTQRAADTAGAGGGGGPSTMPLHTAAASVPSTTDLLVKAGLGEKGADGSFLRSTPPPGVEASFTVQTMSDTASTHRPDPVQRDEEVAATTAVVAGGSGGGGGGGGAAPEQDVRKLYLKIRSELEADLRRQLEAKSRYNRYRP